MSPELSCSNWGDLSAPMTDRPGCQCRMCLARRWDRLRGDKSAAAEKAREQLERKMEE